jgi:predicted small lipoprotein YifL
MTNLKLPRVAMLLLAALLVAAPLVSGCGQKGPLFLPGNPSEMQTEVPAKDPQQVNEKEDDEDDYEFEQQSQ